MIDFYPKNFSKTIDILSLNWSNKTQNEQLYFNLKMIPVPKKRQISPQQISLLLKSHYSSLIPGFYETQSSFLGSMYKRYHSIEAGNIILCFARNIHLQIIRQREKNLNFDISLDKFWKNFNQINKPYDKIANIVKNTGIPKETVRRKINKLLNTGLLSKCKTGKGYSWDFLQKEKNSYTNFIIEEINILARYLSKFSTILNLNLNTQMIEKEIRSQFSFYWYHFLSCELEWLKMWQLKLKDNDLVLISLQATIPTLEHSCKNSRGMKLEDVFKVIGSAEKSCNYDRFGVGASSVSEITGIPRATCVRKLDKLVSLGFLVRENKSKKYIVSQITEDRTKNIMDKQTVNFTIDTFSEYFAIILNSLIYQK